MRATTLRLGPRTFDIRHRPLVMGILNRTPDSFYDKGATFALDDLVRRAGLLVDQGADLLDVGGVKAGPGPEVGEAEELDRVIPAIEALADRFDVALSVDTWRASVARAAYRAGAVVGNDISGFADPDYLPAAAEAGATVVATHIRLGPRIPDPDPVYDDVVDTVRSFLVERAERARAAGLAPDQIVIDAGLDLGKTARQSLALLRASDRLADLGYPLLLSASNKTFLGVVLGLEIGQRREASLAATVPRGGPGVPGDAGPRGGCPPPGLQRDGRPGPGRHPVSAAGHRHRPPPRLPGEGTDPRSSPRPPTPWSSGWSTGATRRSWWRSSGDPVWTSSTSGPSSTPAPRHPSSSTAGWSWCAKPDRSWPPTPSGSWPTWPTRSTRRRSCWWPAAARSPRRSPRRWAPPARWSTPRSAPAAKPGRSGWPTICAAHRCASTARPRPG